MQFTTPIGQTVELSDPLSARPYMYCHGCGPGSGRKLPRNQAEQIAAQHASICRRNGRR